LPGIPRTPTGCAQPFDEDFSYPSWTVGLDYQAADDLFLYVKSSRASMAGGFNTRSAPPGEQAFGPEEVTDYEIGAKLDALDGRLRTNIAVFHANTKDAQRIASAIVGNVLSNWVQNTGEVKTDGVELEVTAVPWDGMQVSVGASYLDARYKDGSFVEDRGPAAGGLVDRSDEPMPFVPEWAYTVGVVQDLEFGFGAVSLRADWAWVDEKAFQPQTANANATPAALAAVAIGNEFSTADAYGLLGARASVALQNGIEVALWGRNLLDEEYFTFGFNSYNAIGFVNQNQGWPRTYGVQIGYTF
jgi:iron complex outermembrane recepter protein